MKCLVEDCDRQATRRNMCSKHYMRWRKHGSPLIVLKEHAERGAPQEFIEMAIKYQGDNCLLWPYADNNKGYGHIRINGEDHAVHIFICERINGPRPSPDHVASHKCGKGHLGCVNPNRLRWQTWKEDRADMVTHGTITRGSQISNSKLTEGSIQAIRSLEGKLSQKEIAEKFSISEPHVSLIMQRKSWAWLK